MQIIGITGSIGSGKTTIANIISKLGYSVWNIDNWVKRLYHQKYFLLKIAKAFPNVFEEGVLNKRKLRNFVFNDKKELQKLEAIIHPIIKKEFKFNIHKSALDRDFIFFEQALLFEMGWDKYCNYIILADVAEAIAKERVIKRDNISGVDFDKINDIQIKNIDKMNMVDIIINTNQAKNLLRLNIIEVLENL